MDLILRNLRLREGAATVLTDLGIAGGRIAAMEPGLDAEAEELDLGGRFVVPGFVESHIHLDKACILERCAVEEGTLREAIVEVAKAKRAFTVEDIRARAIETLERCILQGTTRMRSHLEVDPVIGMKGIEAVLPLIDEYRWAIDLEICVFPQEGLLDNPGTDALMVEALRRGARVVGGCPYTDSDPEGQIDRVFEMAREFDVDIDFHLDFDTSPEGMTLGHVCDLTARFGWGGRVAIGHVSKLSALPAARLRAVASRLADAGVAVTVLPSTDLYLMGAGRDHDVVRGVAPVHRRLAAGVNCALSTNNLLNPCTPFGDGSMIRMANLYANIAQIGTSAGIRECLSMVTERPARLMRHSDYGIAAGHPADLVVLDCESAEAAVRMLATPLMAFKNGRRTFTRRPAQLHRP
ncbi:MAG: amidohydrolase family protein [Proteobacteria bacterium]|nr:amidohydrolase family protein [Pseudomonadota bacterium]